MDDDIPGQVADLTVHDASDVKEAKRPATQARSAAHSGLLPCADPWPTRAPGR
jgi:hypothetical protein